MHLLLGIFLEKPVLLIILSIFYSYLRVLNHRKLWATCFGHNWANRSKIYTFVLVAFKLSKETRIWQ